jgi:hypothetical protein
MVRSALHPLSGEWWKKKVIGGWIFSPSGERGFLAVDRGANAVRLRMMGSGNEGMA